MRSKILRELGSRKVQAYLLFGVGLCVGYALIRGSNWQSDAHFHTFTEAIAALLALMVGIMALIRYYSEKNSVILFVGVGFFGTALLDGFHAIVTSAHFQSMVASDLVYLTPWSWIASRLFLSVLLCLSWAVWWRASRLGKKGEIKPRTVYAGVGTLLLVVSFVLVFAPLPDAYFSGYLFHRPEEFAPALFFGLAMAGYLHKSAWRTDPLEHSIVLSLIAGFVGEAVIVSSSARLFDIEFDLAHSLKIVSYILVLTGLLAGMFVKFRKVEVSAAEVVRANATLQGEIEYRKKAEASLIRAEEQTRMTLTALVDAVLTIDMKGTITWINPAGVSMFGYEPHELIDQNIKLLMTQDDSDHHDRYLSDYLETGKPSIIGKGREVVGRRKDGSTFPLELAVSELNLAGQRGYTGILRDITERKQAQDSLTRANTSLQEEVEVRKGAQAALLKAEEQTRMILTTLVDAVITIDREGTITSINPAGVTMFGYEPLDLIDCNIKLLMTEDDSDHHDRYLSDYLETGKPSIIGKGREVVGRRKDGSTFPLELAVSELNSAGQRGYTGILRDLTDRKHSEDLSTRLGRIIEDSSNEVYVFRADTMLFSMVNRGARDNLGYTMEELTALTPYDIMPDFTPEKFAACIRPLRDGNVETITFETIHERKDGTTYDVEVHLQLARTETLPVFIANIADVTERKQVENDLALARERLDEAIESIPDGFAIYDHEDRLVMANQRLRELHTGMAPLYKEGRTYEEIIRAAIERDLIPDVVGPEDDWIRERVAEHRSEKGSSFEGRSDDGRWIKASDRPTKEGGTVSLRTDISELKRRETELKRSNDELERFAYVASHDLQEPLRKVQAFGDRLTQKYGDVIPEEGRDYVARMQDASARMRGLINDLLDFARVTSSGKPFERADPKEIIAGVVGDLEVALSETGGRVDVGTLPTISADPSQMRQLFQNLIGNALKFQKPGEAAAISVQCANAKKGSGRPDTQCEILVEDSGIGFDEKHGSRIFEMFKRLHNRTEYAGTGVGLAICRRIVQRHGGTIEAEGKPGEGATFRIRLPLKQEREEKIDEAA